MNLSGKDKIIIGPEVANHLLDRCAKENIQFSKKLMEVLTAVQKDGGFKELHLVSLPEQEIGIIKNAIDNLVTALHKKPPEDLSLGSFHQYILGGFVYYKNKDILDPNLAMPDQTLDPPYQNLNATLKKSLTGFLPYRVGIRAYAEKEFLQKDGYMQFDSKQQFENRLKGIFGGSIPTSLQKQLAQVRDDADTIIMSSAYRCIPTSAEDKELCAIQWDIDVTCLYEYRTKKLLLTYDFPTMQQGHECVRRMVPDMKSRDQLLDNKIDAIGKITQETVEVFSQYDCFLTKIKQTHPELTHLLLARRDVQDKTSRQDILQRIQKNDVWKTMIEQYKQVDIQDKIASLLSGLRGKTFAFVYYQKNLGQNEKGYVDWEYPPIHDNHASHYAIPLQDILSICKGPVWTIPVEEHKKKADPPCLMNITIQDTTHFRLRISLVGKQSKYYECEIGLNEMARLMLTIGRYFGSDIVLLGMNPDD